MKNTLIALGVALFFSIVYTLAGSSDYKEQKREEAEYCHNVRAGLMPDYNHNFMRMCLNPELHR